ncbi:4-hydroxybenzoate transporter [Klebsiella pneumoniae]|uniref:4-hydroxybenzoate transporter n=1 Tax=Klebsiella pneumoniae TaxID=573 RepID=A0A2X3D3C2_KLEPN|nr:4-hydroxybenzoate transporter [Klebsiella pneumoniae]
MNHTNVVDVKAWIDARPVSRFQWNVLLLCFIIIMLDGYDAAVMGFVAPALIEDWGISRAEMGPILGAAMFGVAIGALVAGPLSDRYGRKRILLWSVALFALFSLAGAVAQSPSQLALMRFLTGLGLGAVMPNCVTLVAEYMPERRKGVMITLMYSGFNVGSGLGGFIAAGCYRITAGTWRWFLAACCARGAPLYDRDVARVGDEHGGAPTTGRADCQGA